MTSRPAFGDLPELSPSERHSWAHYGAGDDLGALNELTPERVRAASEEIRSGERIDLDLAAELPDPPLFGRGALQHTLIEKRRNTWDDRLDAFFPQRSTQWDGFRHIRVREHGFYGGVVDDPPSMGDRLGVHHWARQGIVARGVLLDVAGYWRSISREFEPFDASEITLDDMLATADAQGTTLRPGDVLCVRTGWAARYKDADSALRSELANTESGLAFIGLSSASEVAEFVWDSGVAAVAVDNPGVEWAPGDPAVGTLHRRLLAQLGVPLGEMFDFDALAERSRADGRWTFFFVSVPLAIAGGVGTPANAVAIR